MRAFENYTIYDNQAEYKNIMICTDAGGGIIVGKVSPRKASNLATTHNKIRLLLKKIQKVRPNQKRGEKNEGINKHYSFFGHGKDPLKSGTLSENVFKNNVSEDVTADMSEKTSVVAGRLERIGHTLIYKCDGHKDFMAARDHLSLPTVGRGQNSAATQVSVCL